MNNLRKIRLEKKLTQTQIGQMINVTRAYISYIEIGRSQLNEEQIIQLCKSLNISADYLLGITNKEKD